MSRFEYVDAIRYGVHKKNSRDMAYGYIENNKIIRTKGIIKDYEAIAKIDNHKRKAIIELNKIWRKKS